MKKIVKKLLSMALVLVSLLGMLPVLTQPAAAVDYAAAATEAELEDVQRWFSTTNGAANTGTFAKVIDGVVYVWGSNRRGATGMTNQSIKGYTNAKGQYVEDYKLTRPGGDTDALRDTDIITVPTPMPKSFFNNEKVVRVTSGVSCFIAVTEKNNIFVWGHSGGGVDRAGITGYGYNPRSVDCSVLGADPNKRTPIVKITTCGISSFAMDANGKWYSFGAGNRNISLQGGATSNYTSVLTPIPQAIVDQCGGGIRDIAGAWNYMTIVVGTNGKLYFFPQNADRMKMYLGYDGWPTNADNTVANEAGTVPVKLSDNVTALKGVKFTSCVGEDWSTAATDENGDCWGFGANNSEKFGHDFNLTTKVDGCYIDSTHKFFDHNVFQKKAVRCWISSYRSAILCEDNTAYAVGDNTNGIIKVGGGAYVGTVTQILEETSKNETIVGIFPANDSQMVITKAGDMHFAGNNATGGAGDGSIESAPPGEQKPVISEDMPPSAPLTANKISFEIEAIAANGSMKTYVPTNQKESGTNRMLYQVYSGGKLEGATQTLTIDAGANFKLNVYFEDFGKMQTFVVPIRFDPALFQVVNGAGVAYSEKINVVTPGAYGANVGIEQCFDTQDWPGGYLNVGTAHGTYPKISNGGGYVSVAGYTTDKVGAINGKVKMFSIAFRAQTNATNVGFDFAYGPHGDDPGNIPAGVKDNFKGYDDSISSDESHIPWNSAYWSISNATGSQGVSGYFRFNPYDSTDASVQPLFPKFNTTFIPTQKITLSTTYGTNNATISDILGATSADPADTGEPFSQGWRINWTNKDVVYTVKADSWGAGTNVKASFPDVTWAYKLYDKNGNAVADLDLNDDGENDNAADKYIVITSKTATTISFKINPSFTPATSADGNTVTEQPVYVEFIATSKRYTSVNSAVPAPSYYFKLKNFQGPKDIKIAQEYTPASRPSEWSDANSFPYLQKTGTDSVIIYHYTDGSKGENYKFYPFYGYVEGDLDGDGIAETNPAKKTVPFGDVVWTLTNSKGEEFDQTAADAVAQLKRNDDGTVTIKPQFTIKHDDYLILHVESLYDSTACDDIKIKIQLYATGLKFSPETLRMAISTAEVNSSVDLKQFLQIEPADVYATDLTWKVEDWPTGKPGNYGDDPWVEGTSVVVYGTLGAADSPQASVFNAFGYATPTVASCNQEQYVQVTVTDSYSGKSKTVEIAIMDISSPIGMEQFEAVNAVGFPNDVVKIKDKLEVNDVIRFYETYEDAQADQNALNTNNGVFSDEYTPKWKRETTIVNNTMVPAFTFAVGDKNGSMMKGEGGYLYATVTRPDATKMVMYDPVPVVYGSEPSLVYGYVHLYGKITGSLHNAGVTVSLVGGDFKEFVTTDTNGYFKFTKYIAPGEYTMTISKQNYLTRVSKIELYTTSTGKFMISSNTNPITLFPGELTSDDKINISDITYYVANWVGITDDTVGNFEYYDFVEDGKIGMTDLELLLQRRDWTPTSYPQWVIQAQ